MRRDVPFGFPSHQGLLAPLWRLWPARFSVLALWVGAIVPDVIDGSSGLALRRHLGQWIGHSLLGLLVLAVPIGLPLTWLVRHAARRSPKRIASWIRAVDNLPCDAPHPGSGVRACGARLIFEGVSVWIGALSHIAFDLVSHERSMLLWPWADDPAWLGEAWRSTWFRVSVPGYAAYSIGPHFVGWIALSVAGAAMFFAYPPRR
jgi:hypothetical protein